MSQSSSGSGSSYPINYLNQIISLNDQETAAAWDWWKSMPDLQKEKLLDLLLFRLKSEVLPKDGEWIVYRLAYLKFSELAERQCREVSGG